MVSNSQLMQASLKWNLSQFNDTLARAAKESSRAAPLVINGHALAVASRAIELTDKANRQQIAHVLGQTGTQLNWTKKGTLRKGRRAKGQAVIKEGSLAARIVNARRREYAGPEYQLWGNALESAARVLIAARQRGAAFIKSGWIWALRDLSQVVRGGKRSVTDKDVKAVGARKGKAVPARANSGGGMFKATIENTSLIQSGGKFQSKGSHNPLPIAEKGLALALAAETKNMQEHLMKKEMTAAMKKAGAM